jgi:hypothetical protein
MFVPIHGRRRGASGGSAQVKVKPAVLMAVATAVAAGIASDVLHAGAAAHSDSGSGRRRLDWRSRAPSAAR